MLKGFAKCFGLKKKKKSKNKQQIGDESENKNLVDGNNAKIATPEQKNQNQNIPKIVVNEQNNVEPNKEKIKEEEVEEVPLVKTAATSQETTEWYKIVKDGKEVNVSKEEYEEYINGGLRPNETKKCVTGKQVTVHNEWFKIVKDGKEINLTKDEYENYMNTSGLKKMNNRNENEKPNSSFGENDSFEPILRKDHRNEKPSVDHQDKPTAPISESEFAADCLKWHNDCRRKHGVPDLVLNLKLSSYASEWANKIAKSGNFAHRPDCDHGENIWYRMFSDPKRTATGKDPVDDWYSEVSRYHFGGESNSLPAGHFTQVVWKSSKELGVGMARNGNKWYVVCNYEPAGNKLGDFASNVPAPIN